MLKIPNLRITRQRQVILTELRRLHTHPSADELYQVVRRILPRISLGTVYRNLEILCALGEIQKLEISGGQKRFDGNPNNHYHIRCIHCDRLQDAPLDRLPVLDEALTDVSDFQVMGHRLEFIGLCAACLQKVPANTHKKPPF